MLFDLWTRAQAKWRGLLVYSLLQATTRFVTSVIYHEAETSGLRLYSSCVALATTVFCLTQLWLLLTTDRDGDEAWPPIWS